MNIESYYEIIPLPRSQAPLKPTSQPTKPQLPLELFEQAKSNPWQMFTSEQIADIFYLHRGRVRRAKEAPDSPFRYNKCRPEDFQDWLKRHPELKEDKLEERPVRNLKRTNRRK